MHVVAGGIPSTTAIIATTTAATVAATHPQFISNGYFKIYVIGYDSILYTARYICREIIVQFMCTYSRTRPSDYATVLGSG